MRPGCITNGCRTPHAEACALSPDTKALLERMGHKTQEEAPWGEVALIASGTPSVAESPDALKQQVAAEQVSAPRFLRRC